MRVIAVTLIPALVLAVMYYTQLGYRRDYLGHYAGGYGGTLGLLLWLMRAVGVDAARRAGPMIVVAVTVVCVGLGVITEATVFRIARFDEIDFGNQSIGAVLAGLAALGAMHDLAGNRACSLSGLIVAFLFFASGFYFALF